MKLKGMLVSVGPYLSPIATDLNPFYSAWIVMTKTIAKFIPDKTTSKTIPVDSTQVAVVDDQPGQGVKLMLPTVTIIKTLTSPLTPEQSIAKAPAVGRQLGYQYLVTGAQAFDSPTYTDQLTAAQNATANDMTLLPAVPAVNDAYYFGFSSPFHRVWLNIGTNGAGNWTTTEEYWNGAAWAPCVIVTDKISSFIGGVGMQYLEQTPQLDWAVNAVNGVTLYWIRFRVSAFVSVTTAPKGTQAWVEILHP